MSDFNVIKNDNILKTFFDRHPEFDRLNFNWFDRGKVEALNWQGLDKDKICDRLKAYQRLLRLGLDPSDIKKLLDAAENAVQDKEEKLFQASPEKSQKLDSALAIASISEAEFIQTSKLDPEKARETHRNATQTTAGGMVLLANTIQFASPRVGGMLADNAAQVRQNFQALLSYQKLFGSLDYLQCDPCQSIFSPAAYFVDLMRLVDQYITQANKIPEGLKLSDRRPDLEEIPLTCDNTNDTVPYTQIVSEVLAKKFKKELEEDASDGDAFRHLATAKYPRNLPFNLYLEQIRTYLSHLNTNLADIYESFHPQERRSNVWAREYLGLSPEEYALITTANSETSDLSLRYGVNNLQNNWGGLTKKETFLKQTRLSGQELKDLFYQNLSPKEVESDLAHQFYINKILSQQNYLILDGDLINFFDSQAKTKTEFDKNQQEVLLKTLDRVDRFLRLARKLNWSFADLDWVLTSIEVEDINEEAITKIAKIKQLQAITKLPLDVLCSFWYEMKAIGKGDNPNRPQDLFDRVFNNPLMLQGQAQYQVASAWKIDNLNTEEEKQTSMLTRSRLLAALQLSAREFTDIVEGIWNGQTDIELNVANLSRLFRTSQILKLLGLKVGEYKLLLEFLNESFTSLEKLELDKLTEIIEFAQWLKVSGFSLYELDYILNGTVHPSVEVFLPEEKMASFMESLWQKLQLPDVEWHLSPEDCKLITTPNASSESLSQRERYGVDVSQNLGGLTQKETFIKQTNLSEQELRDLLYQNFSQEEINSGKAHQFYINKKLSDNKYLNLSTEGEIENLDLETLDRVDRVDRLARKLNWSFADLDWVLALTETEDIDSDALSKVTEIKHLQEQTKLPLAEIRHVYDNLKAKIKDAKIEIKTLVLAVQEKQFAPQIAIDFGMELGVFSLLAQLATQIVKNNVWANNYVELLLAKTEMKQDNETWKKIVSFLKFISRTRLLVGKLGLTEIEVRSVCERPEAYNIKSFSGLERKFVRINSLSKLSKILSKGVSWLFNKIIGKTADEIFGACVEIIYQSRRSDSHIPFGQSVRALPEWLKSVQLRR